MENSIVAYKSLRNLTFRSALFFLVCCGCRNTPYAQTFTRANGENALDFVERNTPRGLWYYDQLKTQMFETSEWSNGKSIFGFYNRTYHAGGYKDDESEDILGYLYVPVTTDTYRRVFIDTFENEGGAAEIISIFYANADRDTARELVVLIRWLAIHYQIYAYLYETRIYDNIAPGSFPEMMTFLKDISAKVSGDIDGDVEGKKRVSMYKSAAEIKAGLKRMGY